MITTLIAELLNVNHFLPQMIEMVGPWVYVILFVLIFMETGFVVTPFFPGDSILFLSGSLVAVMGNKLNIILLAIILCIAAISGDNVNYIVGRHIGRRISLSPRWAWLMKAKYMVRTQSFFHRHGSGAVFLGRFIPLVRTAVPFIAGISCMNPRIFITFNFWGGIAWVIGVLAAGYFFGTVPFVKAHLELILLGIVILSLFPAIIGGLISRVKDMKSQS